MLCCTALKKAPPTPPRNELTRSRATLTPIEAARSSFCCSDRNSQPSRLLTIR